MNIVYVALPIYFLLSFTIGGVEIVNIRSHQISRRDVNISWDAPLHPVGGYTLRSARLKIDMKLDPEVTTVSVRVPSISPGIFAVELQSTYTHFASVWMRHNITLRGEP